MLNASLLSDEDILDPHRPHVTLEMQVQALTTELHQTTKALAASQADAARAKSALARLQGATVKGMTDTQLAALEAEMQRGLCRVTEQRTSIESELLGLEDTLAE